MLSRWIAVQEVNAIQSSSESVAVGEFVHFPRRGDRKQGVPADDVRLLSRGSCYILVMQL